MGQIDGYIGGVLKKLREEKGLTQAQLAKEVGLSKSAIIHYENNNRKPSFDASLKLEDYFKVSHAYLSGESDQKSFSDDKLIIDKSNPIPADSMNLNTVGERINLLRTLKKMSMDALGKELGTSSSNVSDWENDKKQPSVKSLIALSDFFGVTIDFILKGKGSGEFPKRPFPITTKQTGKIIEKCLSNKDIVLIEAVNRESKFGFELFAEVHGVKYKRGRPGILLELTNDHEKNARVGHVHITPSHDELYARLSHLDDNLVLIDTTDDYYHEEGNEREKRSYMIHLNCSHDFFLAMYNELRHR